MANTIPPDWQQTIDIAVPDYCAGQQPNIRIVIGWQSAPKDLAAGSSSRRFAAPQDDLVLDPGQRQVLAAWKQRRSASADAIKPEAQAWRMDRTLLDWRHAMPADRFADESGQALPALGHLRLWDAAGPQVEWLDLELVVQARGGWHRLALYCVDVAQGGESRTWLLLDPGELDASALDVRFLRSALCDPTASIWVCRYAGLGAFVMLAVDLARLSGESMAEAANACP